MSYAPHFFLKLLPSITSKKHSFLRAPAFYINFLTHFFSLHFATPYSLESQSGEKEEKWAKE